MQSDRNLTYKKVIDKSILFRWRIDGDACGNRTACCSEKALTCAGMCVCVCAFECRCVLVYQRNLFAAAGSH